jgi:NAD(P)H-nitrite reductase large subunit
MADRVLVLGNGGAAVSATTAMRSSGFDGHILVLSDDHASAFNPMLAPYYLKGAIPWERCFPFDVNLYDKLDVACVFRSPVAAINAHAQVVITENGHHYPYDRCLIATGASAVVPPIPGLKGSDRVFVLRTPESARHLESMISPGKKAVVLGASFVGLKVAEILRKRDVDVILLDVVDQILPRGAHRQAADLLRGYLEKHGIDVRLGCAMEGMEGASDGVACYFSDGVLEEADFVVACTGVRSNLGFIDRNEVRTAQGIVVDDHMRTSAPNLYAAGDVCEARNALSGNREIFGTWLAAILQGRAAGRNIGGEDTSYGGSIQENISPFFGWHYAQIGDVRRSGEATGFTAFGDPEQGGYGIVCHENGVIVGANLINCTHLAGSLRFAIMERVRIEFPSAFGFSSIPQFSMIMADILAGCRQERQ